MPQEIEDRLKQTWFKCHLKNVDDLLTFETSTSGCNVDCLTVYVELNEINLSTP